MTDRNHGRGWQAHILIGCCGLALVACTAGAGTSGSTSATISADGASPSPLSSLLVAPSGVAEPCTTASLDASVDELMAAIGNPDTNAPSDASQAFESALSSGDPARIEAAAAVVLGHLARGRAMIAAGPIGTDERLTIACREWGEMLRDIAEATAMMRDGGMAGSTQQVEAGRARSQGALLDHFWQSFKAGDPDLFVEHTRDGRTVSASRSRLSTGAAQAFDGNLETAWTTGDAPPPQWIEIDLGWPATITGVRLTTYQEAAGPSDHAITIVGEDGTGRELARLSGETKDRDVLDYTAPSPVDDVQVLRVTTEQAPGSIGWREIEVRIAPGSSPPPCPTSDVPLQGLTAAGGPPSPDTSPALAIDGDRDTAWDPGPSGSISLTFATPALVSSFRVLIGDVPAGAPGWIAQAFDGTTWSQLSEVAPSQATDDWLTIAGPAPCVPLSGFQLVPSGVEPNPAIREIQVLGAARTTP